MHMYAHLGTLPLKDLRSRVAPEVFTTVFGVYGLNAGQLNTRKSGGIMTIGIWIGRNVWMAYLLINISANSLRSQRRN